MAYRLFKTEAKIVSYFWGDDEDDNEYLAKESLIAELNNRDNVVEVDIIEEVNEDMYIEEHWVDGIPYGAVDDTRTVGDIISSGDFEPMYENEEEYETQPEEYKEYEEEDDIDTDIWKEEL